MLSKQIREVRNFQYTQSFHDSEVILKSGRNGLILQIHHQHLTGDIRNSRIENSYKGVLILSVKYTEEFTLLLCAQT